MNDTNKRPALKNEATQRAEFMKEDVLRRLAKLTKLVEAHTAKSWSDLEEFKHTKSCLDEVEGHFVDYKTR